MDTGRCLWREAHCCLSRTAWSPRYSPDSEQDRDPVSEGQAGLQGGEASSGWLLALPLPEVQGRSRRLSPHIHVCVFSSVSELGPQRSSCVTGTPAIWARTLVSLTVELSLLLVVIRDRSRVPRPFRWPWWVAGQTDRLLSSRSRQLSLESERERRGGRRRRGRMRVQLRECRQRLSGQSTRTPGHCPFLVAS